MLPFRLATTVAVWILQLRNPVGLLSREFAAEDLLHRWVLYDAQACLRARQKGQTLVQKPPLLELRELTRSYGPVPALSQLSAAVTAGEIVGLVGENGAGKSTLIRLISGVVQPSGGQIFWEGAAVDWPSPAAALASGIATIHQELECCGHLTVAENMMLGAPWPRNRWWRVDWPRVYEVARDRLRAFDLEIDPCLPMCQLTPAQKQEVAIAAALARNARLLILDEPTASLTEMEATRLCSRLRQFKQRGGAVIYVSHRLDEVLAVSDRIVVLRDGNLVCDVATEATSMSEVVEAMLGSVPMGAGAAGAVQSSEGCGGFSVQDASCAGLFQGVSFHIDCGEIVGLAGLLGSGRSEVARAIFGLYPLQSGHMRLLGQDWSPNSSRQALQQGVVYLPEERKRQGLVLEHTVLNSVGIGIADRIRKWGWIPRGLERRCVEAVLERYGVRASGLDQPVGTLSGGNQQKLLLGRWLEREPRFVILDEPTRGVDVAAKAQIHSTIRELASRGKIVLLISSDLPELVSLSHRVVVLNRGMMVRTLGGSEMTEHSVLAAASTGTAAPTASGEHDSRA